MKRKSLDASSRCPYEGGEWLGKRPKNDDGYFEEMTRTIFQADLNWDVIRKKWPNFRRAFVDFSIEKVAEFDERDVRRLIKDASIVHNEKKIEATIGNAQELLMIRKEYGSFAEYLQSYDADIEKVANDLPRRFRHMGESSSKIFLLTVG